VQIFGPRNQTEDEQEGAMRAAVYEKMAVAAAEALNIAMAQSIPQQELGDAEKVVECWA